LDNLPVATKMVGINQFVSSVYVYLKRPLTARTIQMS